MQIEWNTEKNRENKLTHAQADAYYTRINRKKLILTVCSSNYDALHIGRDFLFLICGYVNASPFFCACVLYVSCSCICAVCMWTRAINFRLMTTERHALFRKMDHTVHVISIPIQNWRTKKKWVSVDSVMRGTVGCRPVHCCCCHHSNSTHESMHITRVALDRPNLLDCHAFR